MPLLKKKPFEKHSISEYLRDDEEVFYCEITDEIFRDYEEFSERMFLYNSMVWTCSMTGKQNLTYQEALESEENAKQSLKEFPMELRLPILYLASKTQRNSFGEMAEDVFMFVKDRYFIGENLETSFTGSKWKDSHVLQVIAPQEDQLKNITKNGNDPDRLFWPPASLFKYELEHLDADDNDISEIMIVDCNQIRRKKGSFNRDKCKLFLKQYIEHGPNGIFAIKPSIIEDFGINKMKFDQIFDGPLPNFEQSKKKEKVPNGKKKSKQETLAKFLTKPNGASTTDKQTSSEKRVNLLEEMKKREEEFRLKKLLKEEEKLALKKKQKQESVKLNSCIREWSKPKEDLMLEDQKKLPVPMPVKTKVSDKYFGEMLMVMEFMETFSKFLSTKDFFPGGFTLELMERALTEKEVAGPLTDIFQMFLTALFNVQDEESNQYRTVIESTTGIKEEDVSNNLSLTDATRFATVASSWSNKYQGLPLARLPLYSVTVSEVLRLHLLASGARINETGARWRYAQRGGYTSEDDPGIFLRLNQPHILKALAYHNVVQLPIADKLSIISCLINQLLTYADVRDFVEERLDQIKNLKTDLKVLQIAEKKREQEFVTNKMKLQKEIKETKAENQSNLREALEKLEKDNERKQIENTRKISKVMTSIFSEQSLMGTDRAYRKYLRMDSVPAIFVVDEDENLGECFSDICKQNPDLVNASRQQLLKHMRRLHIDGNKENTPSKSPKKANGVLNSVCHVDDEESCMELLMCSTDPKTCKIHCVAADKTKWSFIHDEFQLEELERGLNKRGLREGELLHVIKNDRIRLSNVIAQTPVNYLNPDVEIADDEEKRTKNKKVKDKYEDANLGYASTMAPEEVLENALLDNILEMEEKIYAGSLGSLAVMDRDEWRTCLTRKDYDNFEKTIIKHDKAKLLKIKKAEKKSNSRPPSPDNSNVKNEFKEYQDPGRYLGTTRDAEIEQWDDDCKVPLEPPENLLRSIVGLSTALAQVAQAVDPKYLKKPLGIADVTRNDKKQEYDYLDRWEQSLLASTSYSQVFLHYSTLDSCVMWSRSALLARCRICRRQKDSENMLLCDNCNLGHHLYCLKPKLTSIPKGDWFCDRCKREKEKAAKLLSPQPTPTKKRRIFRDEDIEEEEESNGEVEECPVDDADSSDEEMEVDEEVRNGEIKIEICKTCGSGGVLISCEKCTSHYHIECCNPPLRRAPRAPWHCNSCKNPKERRERKQVSDSEESGDEVIINQRRSHRREDGREDLPLHNVALQELLTEVMRHDDAWPFLRPVPKNEVPDYYDVITKPMDFGTIKYKLNMGEYAEDGQLMQDVVLVFENCNTYNDTDADVYKCGVRLLRFFEKKAKELGLKLPEEMETETLKPPKSKKRRTR
nr:bromodomain adjacent to zinc finger domain protein 1A [Leptinotarsa decemlineata]